MTVLSAGFKQNLLSYYMYSFNITLVSNGFGAAMFTIHCVCLSHWERLNWVKFVKISKQEFESQLTASNSCICSLIQHAAPANQGARYISISQQA